jgi:hypothetical protein
MPTTMRYIKTVLLTLARTCQTLVIVVGKMSTASQYPTALPADNTFSHNSGIKKPGVSPIRPFFTLPANTGTVKIIAKSIKESLSGSYHNHVCSGVSLSRM